MKKLFLLSIVLFSSQLLADDSIEQLKSKFPAEYAETLKACEKWAQDDAVSADELQGYLDQCITDEIGYLLDN